MVKLDLIKRSHIKVIKFNWFFFIRVRRVRITFFGLKNEIACVNKNIVPSQKQN